jgi:NCAIR mutase (PurE)-related protein
LTPERLRELLERVKGGAVGVSDALRELSDLPFADLGYARVDHHRALRLGVPEVILAEGKTAEQVVGVAERLMQSGQDVLITRLLPGPAETVLSKLPMLTYRQLARTASYEQRPLVPRPGRPVAVVTAGTSDLPVAEEALETLRMCRVATVQVFDAGVAGVHRLFASLPELKAARAVIVVAGMEGALPSVVGGLVASPVIAVPTSVGYGTSLAGLTALFGMLTSCASGISVVNIDNGFGAAMAVVRMVTGDERSESEP